MRCSPEVSFEGVEAYDLRLICHPVAVRASVDCAPGAQGEQWATGRVGDTKYVRVCEGFRMPARARRF